MKKYNVFLGGTCNNSTWRLKLIPLLELKNITYFNPVVDDWTPECQAIEEEHKKLDDVCLIVITKEMKGVFSIAEAVELSNKRPYTTVFCILYDGFDKAELKSLKATEDLIKNNGTNVASSLEEIQDIISKLITKEEDVYDYNYVQVINPLTKEQKSSYLYKSIFLAGTIDMGNSENWQEKVIQFLDSKNKKCIIYNPRRKEKPFDENDFVHQVNWELDHLEKCDIILIYIAGNSKSPISLMELGLFVRSKKMTVICEPEFYRYGNVKITCEKYNIPLYDNLNNYLNNL